MKNREYQLMDSIRSIDVQIADYESRLAELKRDREGMMNALVDIRVSRTLVMEV